MRGCDLNSCCAKLAEAMEVLASARARIATQWDDQTHNRFEEKSLVPLEAKVRRALDATRQLSELLRKAERECGDG